MTLVNQINAQIKLLEIWKSQNINGFFKFAPKRWLKVLFPEKLYEPVRI